MLTSQGEGELLGTCPDNMFHLALNGTDLLFLRGQHFSFLNVVNLDVVTYERSASQCILCKQVREFLKKIDNQSVPNQCKVSISLLWKLKWVKCFMTQVSIVYNTN